MSETLVKPQPTPLQLFFAMLNPLIALILRSPLHGLLSWTCIVLSFEGRKSGKRYTFPVGYYDLKGDTLIVMPLHRWWMNLRGDVPVTVWLKGRKYRAVADASQGDEPTTDEAQRLIEGSPNLVRVFKIERDAQGQLDAARLRYMASRVALVRIRLLKE